MKAIDKNLLNQLYQAHLNGAMVSDLARANSIRPATLYYALIKIGPIRRGFKAPKGDLSKVFPILSKEAAYIYGLWCADGCRTEKKWSIKLHSEDEYLLEIIKSFLGANELYKDGLQKSRNLIIDIGNEELDFEWFPIRKTINGVLFPVLPEELYSHFIRGYFDGDGSIALRKYRPNQVQLYWCSVDSEFLKRIAAILHSQQVYTAPYTEVRQYPYRDMHTIRVGEHQSRFKLFDWMYQDKGDFYMRRKFDKFENYVNTVLSSGISIRSRDSVTHSS